MLSTGSLANVKDPMRKRVNAAKKLQSDRWLTDFVKILKRYDGKRAECAKKGISGLRTKSHKLLATSNTGIPSACLLVINELNDVSDYMPHDDHLRTC